MVCLFIFEAWSLYIVLAVLELNYIDWNSLELTEIHLLKFPKC